MIKCCCECHKPKSKMVPATKDLLLTSFKIYEAMKNDLWMRNYFMDQYHVKPDVHMPDNEYWIVPRLYLFEMETFMTPDFKMAPASDRSIRKFTADV